MRTIAEMVMKRELQRGNLVTYRPDVKEYLPSIRNTGCENERLFTITDELMWVIRYIYRNGDIEITTKTALHGGLKLKGNLGFMKGGEEIDRTCFTLYSNESIKAFATGYTIEKLNQDNGFYPENHIKNYAYFYTSRDISGTYQWNGSVYEKRGIPCAISGSRFYAYVAGGLRKTDEYGIEFREPTQDHPVLVASDYYRYRQFSKVGDIWLSSRCVSAGSSGIYHYVRYADANEVNASLMCDSAFNVSMASHGIRPVVRLHGSLFVDDKFYANGVQGWNLLN